MRHDEYTLLCETCGYVIDGLPADGLCPECGRSVRSSLPESREGSVWQRHPRVVAWAVTGLRILRHPVRTFSACAIETARADDLLKMNLWLAGLVLAILPALAAVVALMPPTTAMPGEILLTAPLIAVPVCVIFSPIFYVTLGALTAMERLGLRLIGRAHRWRVTLPISVTVCAHASYGWVIGAALVTTFTLLVVCIPRAIWRTVLGPAVEWRGLFIPLAAFAGLLIFETLVYIGVRRCKFANRTRPLQTIRDGQEQLRREGSGPSLAKPRSDPASKQPDA